MDLTPEDEVIIKSCAEYVGRRMNRTLERDDLKQEGRIAVILARRQGRVPEDPVHREKYVAARVLGAMRDCNRKAWRYEARHEPIEAEHLLENTVDEMTPEITLQTLQAIRLIMRRGSPQMHECLSLLVEGYRPYQVAAVLGVDPSRIPKIKHAARALVARCV